LASMRIGYAIGDGEVGMERDVRIVRIVGIEWVRRAIAKLESPYNPYNPYTPDNPYNSDNPDKPYALSTIRLNSCGSRLAPPTSPPSISGCENRVLLFDDFTLPP
jgi:hypothetical protein